MKTLYAWFIKIAIGCVLLGAILVLYPKVEAARIDVYVAQKKVQQRPLTISKVAAIKLDLEKNTANIKAITALLPVKDQLNTFIAQLSKQAQTSGVALSVPLVEEKIEKDESGQVAPPVGPILNVRIKLIGSGDAAALLQFFHFVETSPYLISVESWQLDTASTKTLPRSGALPGGSPELLQPLTSSGYLEARVIIGVVNPNWVKP